MAGSRQCTFRSNAWQSAAVALLTALLLVGTVSAQMMGSPAGVGGDPPQGPFVFTPSDPATNPPMSMVMTATGGPIPIYIDPAAQPWLKTFQITANSVPGTVIEPGQVFQIWEKILVLPPPAGTAIPPLPLTDWHEHIHNVTGGLPFGWVGGDLTIHDPLHPDVPPPLIPPVLGMVDSTDPTSIWFGPWPGVPIPPNGLPVWIHKQLRYLGTEPITALPAPLSIVVWERPTTPEPATLALMGIGGLALASFRRRRRS